MEVQAAASPAVTRQHLGFCCTLPSFLEAFFMQSELKAILAAQGAVNLVDFYFFLYFIIPSPYFKFTGLFLFADVGELLLQDQEFITSSHVTGDDVIPPPKTSFQKACLPLMIVPRVATGSIQREKQSIKL